MNDEKSSKYKTRLQCLKDFVDEFRVDFVFDFISVFLVRSLASIRAFELREVGCLDIVNRVIDWIVNVVWSDATFVVLLAMGLASPSGASWFNTERSHTA